MLRQGKEQGLREGEERGRLEGARRALRHVLALRGLATTAAREERIEACRELETLDRWLKATTTAGSAADVLGH